MKELVCIKYKDFFSGKMGETTVIVIKTQAVLKLVERNRRDDSTCEHVESLFIVFKRLSYKFISLLWWKFSHDGCTYVGLTVVFDLKVIHINKWLKMLWGFHF